MLTRQQAIELFGSASSLAAALGYKSRHAVYMWPKSGPIPREPYLTLRYELRPEAFDAAGNYIGPGSVPVITKRALLDRLALKTDTSLAVLLGVSREEVERWPDDGPVPPLPGVLALLEQPEPPRAAPVEDPDETRIVPVESA